MAWPPDAVGYGHMRASHADRERAVDTLKAAFAQGRLGKDQFDARVGRALGSRTYAELDTVIAGIPAGRADAQLPREPPRRRVSNAARWGASGLITPAILAAAVSFGPVAFVVASVYFVFWLSAGADMLWEWYCLGLPTARMCARCAHTAASHRSPASCTVRRGSVKVWARCSCAGYVPPGQSPRAADRRLASSRS